MLASLMLPLVSVILPRPSKCLCICLLACAVFRVFAHTPEHVRTHFRSPMTQNAEEFIYDLNKLLFEGNHYVSFKASKRSSHFNSWIPYTHLGKWRFRPQRDMELESKAWINYPQLLQEHSFKGYISDHNLWGLCFLHLLHDFTNTHKRRVREKIQRESKHVWGVNPLNVYSLAFGITNVIREGAYFSINHSDEYSH